MTPTEPPVQNLDIAFSPCPNDTFMFHALARHLVDTGDLKFTARLHDIDELNRLAFARTWPVTKMSFFAWLKLRHSYTILDAGAALGYGCGPLLVSRRPERFTPESTVAIPGELTTAHLLLKLWRPDISRAVVTRFDRIMPGVAAGEYEAGLIIHEGRFVFEQYDLKKIVDLGQWWEEETGLPIPLGCIAIQSGPPTGDLRPAVEKAIRASIEHARRDPGAGREYIRSHAREMDEAVIDSHIRLYVNDFSLSLGETGRQAVTTLKERARWAGIL
ncbi:MAG: 1,4-dihydroxy-6-naphthoate synthase [Desulfosudaceae bacterium]